ncbi:MAG: HEAT repeat domain-containing protein, partial [Planctomycetes bacterium]|nr:HEAT repeat domain-containing protein [Planctomycetota bacterium]
MKRIQFSLAGLMGSVLVMAIALALLRSYRPSYFNPINVVLLVSAAAATLIRGAEHRPFWLGFLLAGCVYQASWYRTLLLQDIAFAHIPWMLGRVFGAGSFPSSALRTLLVSMLCDSLMALIAALTGGFFLRLVLRWSGQILQGGWLPRAIRERGGLWAYAIGGLTLLGVAMFLFTVALLWTTWRDYRRTRALFQGGLSQFEGAQAIESLVAKGAAGVPKLCQVLTEGEPFVRALAATALGRMGKAAHEAVPGLIGAVDDNDFGVRAAAIVALVNIEDRINEAIPSLVRHLADEQASVREQAGRALVHAGPSAIPPVIGAIASENAETRNLVLRILGAIGYRDQAAVAIFRSALKDDAQPVRTQAWNILLGTGTANFDDVAYMLQDVNLRGEAVWSLLRVSADPESAIPHLIRALEDDAPELRRAAAKALAQAGPVAGAAVPSLVRALRDEAGIVRAYAATALGKMGRAAASTVPALLECLIGDESEYIRADAATALGEIGPAATSAIPALIEFLTEVKSDSLRASASTALGRLGSAASAAVPALVACLTQDSTPDPQLSRAAARALRKVDATQARAVVPHFRKLLGSEEHLDRISAANALAGLGPEAEAAVPSLEAALGDTNMTVSSDPTHDNEPVLQRAAAATALGNIGQPRESIIPVLVKAADNRHPEIAWSAVRALAEIPGEASVAVPVVLGALEYPNAWVRASAAMALGKLQVEPGEVVPALCHALSDRSHYVRTAAAMTLGQIGPPAKAAVDALWTAFQDADNAVRNDNVPRPYPFEGWHVTVDP